MKIEILGTRAEVEESAPRHSKHSGVLIDERLLFDLGEEEFLEREPEFIFITHLHPDHAIFVRKGIREIHVPIYAPERGEEEKVDIKILDEPMRVGDYLVTPIPTHHSKLVDSQAYLIERAGKRLLYTGDVIWINKEHHDKLQDLDLVITDGSYYRKGGLIRKDEETGQLYGHNGIPDLIDLFGRFTDHILFTHLGGWFYKDIQESRKKVEDMGSGDLKVEAAYDDMTLEI
jgi:glyoxylase-like metal-dependent hydrolase (beta-lactamase superfamily II)